MKLLEVVEEVEEVIGDIEEMQLKIPDNAFAFIFDLVSTKFYSDPIGSLVREIASNCYDANIESGSDKPVVVNLLYDHEVECYYIEFCDNGLGLSPQRMKDIYLNLFTSTKRESNDYIGGFGIGSKSPFAYRDYFYITTIVDSIKYEYIFEKKQTTSPLTLLLKTPTEEEHGTKVRIDLKSHSDLSLFKKAIQNQLCYFDDVYVSTTYFTAENDYHIYEGNTFKYKDVSQYDKFLHIVIGNVAYPLNTTIIPNSWLSIPMALKFAIGELDILPNREAIQYTDRTKLAIISRLADFKQEIRNIYRDQTPSLVDTIDEFHAKRNGYVSIKFGDNNIRISDIADRKLVRWKPFKRFNLNTNLYFGYEYHQLTNGTIKKSNRDISLDHDENLYEYYYTKSFNKYDNLCISDGRILFKQAIAYMSYVYQLGFEFKVKLKRERLREVSALYRKVGTRSLKHKKIRRHRLILKFKKLLHEHIVSRASNYHIATEEWIAEYKALNRTNYIVDKTVVSFKELTSKGTNDYYKEHTVDYLTKFKFVFYRMNRLKKDMKYDRYSGESDEPDHILLEVLEKWKGYKMIKIIEINKTNLDKLKNIRTIHLNDYFAVPELQNYLQKIKIATYIDSNVVTYYDRQYTSLSEYYKKVFDELYYFANKYKNSLKMDLVTINTTRFYDLLYKMAEYQAFKEQVREITYLTNSCPDDLRQKFIKQLIKSTKLNHGFYKNN